ncbi:MAG: AhpC/TSA family protein [Candidatus Dormibacteraeota bacterium]|nr:AhpC/TSA family protein [Candidatus Dormibacteraeota bacterium]
MAGRKAEIERAGARLVFVGNGSPKFAASFADREVPGCLVLTNPSLDVYRALNLKRGVLATLGPKSILAGAAATLRGRTQTAVQGDPWQQGGLVLMMPDGRLPFIQRNQSAGDRPDLRGALESLAAQALAVPAKQA